MKLQKCQKTKFVRFSGFKENVETKLQLFQFQASHSKQKLRHEKKNSDYFNFDYVRICGKLAHNKKSTFSDRLLMFIFWKPHIKIGKFLENLDNVDYLKPPKNGMRLLEEWF